MDMDMRLKPCTTAATDSLQDICNRNFSLLADRLSVLPDELLIRILSLLPTKYAAATCVLSNRLKRVLPMITSLDFDSSPISFCLEHPYRIQHFSSFVTFVNTLLQGHQFPYLTKFRLVVGADSAERYEGCNPCEGGCKQGCYPDLKSTDINAWITFPLTHSGLKELDLRIPVKEPGDSYQLPPEIFTCESLEVLKLDIDLRLDHVSAMPFFHLPNLKLLELNTFSIPDDGFLTRLISSCPLLEDLTVEAFWYRAHYINISSTSLRRLGYHVLNLNVHDTDYVFIHTPNLEYLEYTDGLTLQYSIPTMKCLVKAHVCVPWSLTRETRQVSFQQMLRLIRPLCNVQHLVLLGQSTEILDIAEVVDQLPVFKNLKCLELQYSVNYWDKVLLAFLKCSPVLETLAFPWGMVLSKQYGDYNSRQSIEEREFCRKSQSIISSCCSHYLKRILVEVKIGNEREMDLIKFLLRHALALEELIISLPPLYTIEDRMELESKLQNLPRASTTCSIRVQDKCLQQMV